MVKTDGWDAYVTKGTSGLGVVVIHEIFGLTDYVKSVADALSSAGHSAAAVDYFKGKTAKNLEEGYALRASVKKEDVVSATQAGFKNLRSIGADKLGTLGFCMGGGFALQAACNMKDASFCVDYYGMIENAEEAANLNGPVLLIMASEDTRINPWAMSNLLPAAVNHKKRVEVQLYPNAKHAFHNNTGANYNEAAANDAWQRTIEFLSRV